MEKALSKNNMVVVSQLGDYWVSQQRADNIAVLLSDPSQQTNMVDIDGTMIRISRIDGVLKPDEYNDLQKKRRGGWQCRYNKWHERGQTCAHNMEVRVN